MQWHHRVQERWAGATLYFWFLTFRLSYDPDEVLPALDQVAHEFGLSSFASYELLGMYDIMLRVYMPAAKTKKLKTALRSHEALDSLERVDLFRVDEIARHWCWAKKEEIGPTWPPVAGALERRRPQHEIARINEVGSMIERAMRTGGDCGMEWDDDTHSLIEKYEGERLVTFSTRSRGIKLVILVHGSNIAETQQRTHVKRTLTRVLDDNDIPVSERSLYVGEEGQSIVFLILCRVDFTDFHKIRSKFVQSVRDAVAVAGARTMTLVAVSDDFHCFHDAIPSSTARSASTHHLELLQGSEGQYFEVKGTAFADIDPWLREDKPLEEHDWIPLRGILKSITGFLNSGGGTLVIGALEIEDYANDNEELDRKIADYPQVGPHFCIGLVDPSFTENDWEYYKRRIGDTVAGKIQPHPGVLVQPRHEFVERHDICVIEVADPGPEGDEYYLIEDRKTSTYYGRVDNKTVPLKGVEIQQHRKTVQRRRALWDD
jgi:hypothetical protein